MLREVPKILHSLAKGIAALKSHPLQRGIHHLVDYGSRTPHPSRKDAFHKLFSIRQLHDRHLIMIGNFRESLKCVIRKILHVDAHNVREVCFMRSLINFGKSYSSCNSRKHLSSPRISGRTIFLPQLHPSLRVIPSGLALLENSIGGTQKRRLLITRLFFKCPMMLSYI